MDTEEADQRRSSWPLRNLKTRERDGNAFALIADGHQFFERMLAAIRASRQYVLVEFYLVRSGIVADSFIEALCAAAGRGVSVRVMFDALGARGLSSADRQRLRSAGIQLALYNPLRWRALGRLFQRDHRKLLLVDGTRAFTGGVGLTDEFSPDALPDRHWQDCMLEIRGPVLLDWQRLFARTWDRCSAAALDVATPSPQPLHPGSRGRVVSSSGPGMGLVGRSIIARVARARRRAWIVTAYFWPSKRLRRALRAAARRGVDVRLILTGPYTDAPAVQRVSRLFYRRLLASGVVIYEYQARFLHCKLALCDDWASIGSSNLDRWGSLWNLEANQEVDSADFAHQVVQLCTQLCAQSRVLRTPGEVASSWSAYVLRPFADFAFEWSERQVMRLRAHRLHRRARGDLGVVVQSAATPTPPPGGPGETEARPVSTAAVSTAAVGSAAVGSAVAGERPSA